ncbi:MAG TPA: biopolymer transporter ExbD [Polyangiaceae bacterium]|nr:biopolymer transporter ExbD [Polyangiaceae bacterium]
MNVTPLVDVVLVLLIIFMVITPALADGEPIETPKMTAVDPKPKELHPIEVNLALNGRAIVNDEDVAPANLENKLRELHKTEPERTVLLNTDERVEYRKVRTTFAMLQKIGFRGVSLKVVEKKKPGKEKS